MVLIASSRSAASIRWFSFPVGDVVFRVAQAGDVLNLVRTGSGDLGLSILREDRAVLALGAIAAVPLGAHLRVANRVPEPEGPERCVQVDVGGVSQVLRARESIQVAGYDVYCERACTCHPDGPDECLAIVEAGNPTVTNAAIRSAVLLAQPWRDMLLVGEGWDGQFVRAC